MFEYKDKPDLIVKKLYLGNCSSAENFEQLKDLKISHILVAGNFLEQIFPREFIYKQLFINDSYLTNIKQYFDETYEFIKNGIENGTGVLVHCAAGISRSSSCVIAYLMRENQLTFNESFDLVKSKHEETCPNMGFIRQLKEYEIELKTNKDKQQI